MVSGLLLLVVCINVADVLASASLARHHEIAVRMALGASRATIIRQTLTEGVVLALVGGALGLLVLLMAPNVSAP